MIKYHNALDSFGNTISIDNVNSDNRASMQFTCVGCGAEMVACLGKVKRHYFRHKSDCECSLETYLHQLGKLELKKKFDSQPQFLIEFEAQNYCPKFSQCELKEQFKWQDCSARIIKKIDLKEFYETCEIEVSHKNFRADLMLTHSEKSDRSPVFLEISVTHDCEQNKISSGIRIIEIKVVSETDVHQELIESSSVRFYNFKRQNEVTHKLSCFYLFRNENGTHNGKCKANITNCQNADSELDENACFEIVVQEEKIPHKHYGSLYALGIALSHREGFEVKNCVLCTHYNRCVLTQKHWVKKTSDTEPVLVQKNYQTKNLPFSELDELSLAYRCPKYHYWQYARQKIIDLFTNVPYVFNKKA